MWHWLIRWFRGMVEPVERLSGWMDGTGDEPAWPKRPLAHLHICEGCQTERAMESFAVVDRFVGHQYAPLVRCEECRVSHPVSTTPYDSREKEV